MIRLALASVFLVGCASQSANPRSAPNVVWIVTDDQGFGDHGFARNPVLETPALDALYAQSPTVRRFYVSPVCSPTRASLMTGRYNYRTRVVDTWIGRSMLEPAEVTIAEVLGDAGYRTGAFGKWHLGDAYPLRPIDQGFDRSLVHRGGGIAQPSEPPANRRRYTDAILFRDGVEVTTEGYCTDVYFDAAIDFIDASRAEGRPFFAYVATNAPHGPFHDVPPELYEKYRAMDLSVVAEREGLDLDRVARIFAMVENIDQCVGRLLAHLEHVGLAEDTIVVFHGDNGPIAGRYNAGLRGSKTTVYEGGIRSPLLVRWPGQLAPDTVVTQVAAHIDLFPTVLDAVGIPVPDGLELDGRSLWPLLTGESSRWPDRHVVLQSHRGDVPAAEHNFAIVGKRWKLLRASGFGRAAAREGHPFELYDLLGDPGETRDLAKQRPKIAARMRDAYRSWFESVSTTRADNYAPPRIVVGTEHEPVTTLTHQDWRVFPEERGWGQHGAWHLHAKRPTRFTVFVLSLEARAIDTAVVHVGDESFELEVGAEGEVVELGTVEVAAGDFDFHVECRNSRESFAPYQVVLSTN